MSDLKILNVPDDVIKNLDSIVIQKGYSDRSALIRDILQKYVQFGNTFLVNELPSTVRILVADTLKEYPEKLSELLKYTLKLSEENVRLLNKIDTVFDTESEQNED